MKNKLKNDFFTAHQITSILCDSCKVGWMPDTPIICLTQKDMMEAAKQSHRVVSDVQKLGCVKPVLKVTYENCIIDNAMVNKSAILENKLIH